MGTTIDVLDDLPISPPHDYVIEKIMTHGQLLWESDVMDCFHLLPAAEMWMWLACLFFVAFGLLQYATFLQGHTNPVHFCLFVVY